jgi:hypothetical protein
MKNTLLKFVATTFAGVVITSFVVGVPSIANAQEDEFKDIGSITCKDVLLASGEVRDGVILVLHGYLLGEAKQLTYDSDVLAEATDRFFDACIAAPDAKALETLRDQLKSTD